MRLHRHRKKATRQCLAEAITMYLLDCLLQGAQVNNGPEPLCSEIHCCVSTKATHSLPLSMTKCGRDTTAGPFLGDTWFLTQDCLKDSPPSRLLIIQA